MCNTSVASPTHIALVTHTQHEGMLTHHIHELLFCLEVQRQHTETVQFSDLCPCLECCAVSIHALKGQVDGRGATVIGTDMGEIECSHCSYGEQQQSSWWLLNALVSKYDPLPLPAFAGLQ